MLKAREIGECFGKGSGADVFDGIVDVDECLGGKEGSLHVPPEKRNPFPDIGPGFYTFGLWSAFLVLPVFASVAAAIMPTWSSIWINFLFLLAILCFMWNVLSILFRWYDTPWGRLIPPAVMGNVAGFLYLVPLWRFAGEPLWLSILLGFHYFFCTWVGVRSGKEIYREGIFPKTRLGKLWFKVGAVGPLGGGLIALVSTRDLVGVFIGLVLAACGTIVILYFTAIVNKLKDPDFGSG